MTRPRCVLCDIALGRAPASKILETKRILAIVPLRPKSVGHVLVISKAHAERMHDLPRETLHEIVDALAKIARALDLGSYNILQNTGPGSDGPKGPPPSERINHVHVHLIPRDVGDSLDILSRSTSSPSRDELDRRARAIRERLA